MRASRRSPVLIHLAPSRLLLLRVAMHALTFVFLTLSVYLIVEYFQWLMH